MKMSKMLIAYAVLCLCLYLATSGAHARRDRVKLKDVQTLTLRANEWTTGRRSSPIPQLQCVSGLCHLFKPTSVQCYNRGSDGVDVQWECKTEMDSAFKFGKIDVICEGYEYADDPYVLVGSCALQYAIEHNDNYKPNDNTYNSYNSYTQKPMFKKSHSFSFGFVLTIIGIAFIIYFVCLRQRSEPSSGRQHAYSSQSPPPPGFRAFDDDSHCGSSDSRYGSERHERTAGTGGNGFWTGLLAGLPLGYLFSSNRSRTNYSDQTSYFGRPTTSSSYFPHSSSSPPPSSPSSRTTSGFGGTKRR